MEKNLDLLRDWFLTEQSENEKGTVHREPDEELRLMKSYDSIRQLQLVTLAL